MPESTSKYLSFVFANSFFKATIFFYYLTSSSVSDEGTLPQWLTYTEISNLTINTGNTVVHCKTYKDSSNSRL